VTTTFTKGDDAILVTPPKRGEASTRKNHETFLLPGVDGELSNLEYLFLTHFRQAFPDMPFPEREYNYSFPRRHRADFAFVFAGLLVECEGGVWGGKSAHNSGAGITTDCERSRLAASRGWRVFRVTRENLNKIPTEIMEQLRDALAVTAPVLTPTAEEKALLKVQAKVRKGTPEGNGK
jgi:hypothetical protein